MAIKTLKDNKAPGPDNIHVPAEALKADIETSAQIQMKSYMNCLERSGK